MQGDPLVELVDVAKVYPGGATAVDNFSATLGAGEFVSLLGPSGCGKSTVLRMIAGLTSPSRGALRRAWDGQPDAARQNIGCVFQDPTLLPWTTVWRNVYLPLRLAGVRRAAARERVDEALALVGLSEFALAYPRQLSGGMRMRASLARVLVTQPQLVLLDEPLAALDEFSRQRLNDELRALWLERCWTVLFITHSVFESAYLSTRVLVMSPRPGSVVADIPIELPEPRTAELRTSPYYADVCRCISAALEQAMPAQSSGFLPDQRPSGSLPLAGWAGEGG